jgi:hypothetical protein
MSLIERDAGGVAHIVALSGGDDSSLLSVLLKEREPRPYNYLCTPTGNELPEMFEHWKTLGVLLGKPILPIMHRKGLKGIIRDQKMLPNFRARFCTRIAKIEPYRAFLFEEAAKGPVVSYVGLRADEPGRAGGAYDDIPGVTMRFPLREWDYTDPMVMAELASRGIVIPRRTDCAVCYHQRIGEWYLLWLEHPEFFDEGIELEDEFNATFRTPGRDSWPSGLREMRAVFEGGRVPTVSLNRMKRERMEAGGCRVCSI